MKLRNVFDRRGTRGLRGLFAKILLISLVMGMLQIPAYAAGTECSTSGPISAVYSVTVCITAPVDAAIVSGVQNVTATVTVSGTNPGIARLMFYLGGDYLLTDFQAPYSFKLPTTKWVDAIRSLEVEARMRDGFTSTRASISLSFVNGIVDPPVNTNTFTPATGTTPPAGQPFVLATTGDGASGVQNSDAVADLIEGWDPNMMLYLGGVYDEGTPTEFYNWYGTGGEYYSRFNDITNPTVGSQEYADGAALGYFDYWDNVPHYYSFDAEGWHIVSLDSSSQFDQTDPGTDQYDWLVDDLNDSDAVCTIVYFHHPVFNIGQTGETTRLDNIWTLLAQRGVDIVLTSRDNSYQRWHPMNGQGVQDSSGVTQFVIGTGGHNMQAFVGTDPNLVVGFDTSAAFGALRLELNPAGAAFQFINLQGNVLDSGSVPCSGAPADTTPPSRPDNVSATSNSSNKVNLTWDASTDNVGVTGYDIYRDGTLLTTVTPPATSYLDDTVAPDTTYSYRIRARDGAGNLSSLSIASVVTTPGLLFSDGFESGDLSKWTTVNGLVVQQDEVYAGEHAARGTSTGTPTYAYRQLSQTYDQLYYRLWFKVISQGANQVFLQRFRTASNSPIMGVFIGQTGKLSLRNEITNANVASTTTVTPGIWHQLQVRIKIDGTLGESEVWLDNVRMDALSTTQDLGMNPVGFIQLGETSNLRTYDIALDRVAVNTSFIDPVDPLEVEPPIAEGVNVWVAGEQEGAHSIEHNQALQVNYPGVNQGPVQIVSSTTDTVVGSEAVIYSVNGTAVSFSEMMALPDSQLDTTYWLPWYNNKDLNTQLRFGNVSDQQATVQVFIGGQEMQGSPFTLAPGASIRRSFPGIDSGPVEIRSNQNIVAAERVIYKVNGVDTSFTEMMGLPDSQLETTYWLPWYNNKDLNTQLRIGNVSSQQANVQVFIGGVEVDSFSLAPGASRRRSYANVDSGPVQIVSNRTIVAAERVIYKVNGVFTSFSEMMALPDSQLGSAYWLPWYNNMNLNTQLRVANVTDQEATVHVFIGGVEMQGSPFTLAGHASKRLSYPGINNGPVEIQSTQTIVAAERVIYSANGVFTSFSEMMALPNSQLDTTFWLPWYNNVDLYSELRFGIP